MKKGKSITREIKLKTLQKQGMDYIAEGRHFFCRHCQVPINSPDHHKAMDHVRTAKHLHYQEIRIRDKR